MDMGVLHLQKMLQYMPACSDSEHFVASRMSRHIITITVQWVALDGVMHIMWLSQNL